jgi:replicative DNA helicase
MSDLDRLPPQDATAEQAVLGAMLQESNAASKAFELLEDWCFYKSGHQHIFEAMSALFEHNEPLDVLTVGAELQRRSQLDGAGGNYYLTELVARVSSAANVEYHARIVLEKAILRRLIGVAVEITAEAFEEKERADELLDKAEQRIFDLSGKDFNRFRRFLRSLSMP